MTTLDYAAHMSEQIDLAVAVFLALALLTVLSLGVLVVRSIR